MWKCNTTKNQAWRNAKNGHVDTKETTTIDYRYFPLVLAEVLIQRLRKPLNQQQMMRDKMRKNLHQIKLSNYFILFCSIII
jgi:hypothetical protein